MLFSMRFHPESASTVAGPVDALYFFSLVVSIFFSVLIAGLVVYLTIRYKRRTANQVGEHIHGHVMLEIGWSAIPFAIMMALFVWGAKVFFTISRPPAQASEYFVVGKQWMWKFQHPDGHREINDLHVPVHRPVKFTMTSEDVLHSLYFPSFRVKADVLPGRYTTVWFEATKVGTYHIFCAEYCGASHSGMIGRVIVMEPKDYEAWLAGGAGTKTAAARGEELFTALACVTCHRTDSQLRGPQLAGLFGKPVQLAHGGTTVANEDYLRESILNPAAKIVAGYQPLMPTFKGQIGEDDLLQLISYIKTLQPAGGGAAGGNRDGMP
jgi:cytochrome c oxidase subunit 2